MRRTITDPMGKKVFVNKTWSQHIYHDKCPKCYTVDLSKPATFVNACAEGSPLLMEEIVERQRPEVKRRQKEVLEWAKRAGVFKIPRGA